VVAELEREPLLAGGKGKAEFGKKIVNEGYGVGGGRDGLSWREDLNVSRNSRGSTQSERANAAGRASLRFDTHVDPLPRSQPICTLMGFPQTRSIPSPHPQSLSLLLRSQTPQVEDERLRSFQSGLGDGELSLEDCDLLVLRGERGEHTGSIDAWC
jgi:hypothetical protein